jgi:hypothetical protein
LNGVSFLGNEPAVIVMVDQEMEKSGAGGDLSRMGSDVGRK